MQTKTKINKNATDLKGPKTFYLEVNQSGNDNNTGQSHTFIFYSPLSLSLFPPNSSLPHIQTASVVAAAAAAADAAADVPMRKL